MPADLVLKTMNATHRAMLKLSGGRVGWSGMGMPVVELTTTGRKSGQRRAVMLTAPVHDGDTYVVVASRGGDDTHPAWYLNLVAHPEVEVATKGRKVPMTARVLEGEEREATWQRIIAQKGPYEGYQKKTERQIPLVLLSPVAG